MIKIYVDWNVMSQMKQGNFTELKEILDNREKFMLVYSTSHVGDILASMSDNEDQKAIIKSDLDFITSLTDNVCLFNDSKNICYASRDPHELLQDRLDEAHIFQDFSVDKIFQEMKDEDNPMLNAVLESLESLLKTIRFDYLMDDEASIESMEKLFPGFKEDPTFAGMMKSFGKMYSDLNETESYKDLRSTVQQVGISSGHFSPGKKPFELIENAYIKSGINPDTYTQKSKHAPEWFDEISGEYLKLDLHGYKADKIKVTDKEKNTFRNTTDDSFHSAFASLCEFYITNDGRNYDKTKAVYEKLEIYTKVLKPQEFVDYYQKFLNVHTFDEHYSNLIEVAKDSSNFNVHTNKQGKYEGATAYPNQYFFNFFNKITLSGEGKDFFFLISKESPAKARLVTRQEIESVVEFLVDKLGSDIDGKEKLEFEEEVGSDWDGRKWQTNIGEIRLKRFNNWFQLYFYIGKSPNKFNGDAKKSLYMRIRNWFAKIKAKL